MPVGTSDGEYYEDEFDHAIQTSGRSVTQNPVTDPPQRQEESRESTEKYPLFVVRHGCTDLNAEGGTSTDKIRGWSNVPLNDVGRQDAKDAAKSLEGKGITKIVASDLDRAKETADIIGKHLGVTPDYTMKLRPWDLGKFTGEPAKESREDLKEYSTTKQDEPVPEGESFNTFKFRALQGVSESIKNNPGEKVAIVTHHRVERLLNAWDKQGQPTDGSLHESTFLQKGEPPGGHQIINISPSVHNIKGHGDSSTSEETFARMHRRDYTPEELKARSKDTFDKEHQSESIEDRRNIIDRFFNAYQNQNILGHELGIQEIGADSPVDQLSKDAGREDIANIGALHRDAKRAWLMFREEDSAHQFNEMDRYFEPNEPSERIEVGRPTR